MAQGVSTSGTHYKPFMVLCARGKHNAQETRRLQRDCLTSGPPEFQSERRSQFRCVPARGQGTRTCSPRSLGTTDFKTRREPGAPGRRSSTRLCSPQPPFSRRRCADPGAAIEVLSSR
ncbi:hypothetical protein NDU88_012996 [Pleurodeles waltl]|uniref:Uncharacterized protein n=1 Tax=Pleurodeles waltl TaxID=8319 RepID=A0AAV7R7P0_PLEWA|nr:hypothetical protein NDU88_012996 [Pleurodeles waltl]